MGRFEDMEGIEILLQSNKSIKRQEILLKVQNLQFLINATCWLYGDISGYLPTFVLFLCQEQSCQCAIMFKFFDYILS